MLNLSLSDLIKLTTYIAAYSLTIIFMYWRR